MLATIGIFFGIKTGCPFREEIILPNQIAIAIVVGETLYGAVIFLGLPNKNHRTLLAEGMAVVALVHPLEHGGGIILPFNIKVIINSRLRVFLYQPYTVILIASVIVSHISHIELKDMKQCFFARAAID